MELTDKLRLKNVTIEALDNAGEEKAYFSG